MSAAKLGERGVMRTLALAILFVAPAAAAHADPVLEARSATAACLSAVIDNAPVEDIDGDDATIRRGKDPASCTVRVTAGEPVVVRDAMVTAIKRRSELFTPSKTRWESGEAASRESFCNVSGQRALNVFVTIAKPGGAPVAQATVFETTRRDERCDRDLGLQQVAANDAPPPAATPVAEPPKAEPAEAAPAAAEPEKKDGWLRRRLGLGRKD